MKGFQIYGRNQPLRFGQCLDWTGSECRIYHHSTKVALVPQVVELMRYIAYCNLKSWFAIALNSSNIVLLETQLSYFWWFSAAKTGLPWPICGSCLLNGHSSKKELEATLCLQSHHTHWKVCQSSTAQNSCIRWVEPTLGCLLCHQIKNQKATHKGLTGHGTKFVSPIGSSL